MRKAMYSVVLATVASGCLCNAKIDSDLVFYSKFDSVADVERPTVGPAGVACGAEFVEGKSGRALFVPAYVAAAEFLFPEGLPANEGMIEFDAKLGAATQRFRDGCDPFLFHVKKEHSEGWPIVLELNFNANNGCGQSGMFCGMPFGRAIVIPCRSGRYADMLGEEDTFGWHRYRVCWNCNGIDRDGNIMQLYIDGSLKGSGLNTNTDAAAFRESISSPVRLVFSNPGDGQHGRSPVVIDEFKIWSTARGGQ